MGCTGLPLPLSLQVVVTRVEIWRVGGPGLWVPEVRDILLEPGLDSLGRVGRCRVLLEGVFGTICHLVHPGNDHIPEDIQVDSLVDLLLGQEEVGWHDMSLVADDPKDHDGGRVLGPEDVGDFRGLLAFPPVVVSVSFLVKNKDFFIQKNLR